MYKGECSVEILNVRNSHEHGKMLELCFNLCQKYALIPVIGSGFSFGSPTDNNGTIPSVSELTEFLFKYISAYSNYSPEDLIDIQKESLPDLSNSFWDIYSRIPEEKLEEFYEYINKNFQNISFWKDFQSEFLEIRWPYLFTLNYDSLIENYSSNYYPIIPYEKINRYYARTKTKVYKLHGDAGKYLSTGDNKYFILSRDQYVKSMMDDSNKDMLNELLTAFSSKSILFFGCGLSEELDLLYSSQLSVKERAEDIDTTQQAIIYISFESEDSVEKPFSQRMEDRLARYGITTVFRFFSEEDSKNFFHELREATSKLSKPGIEDFLEKYSSMQFNILKKDDIRCRDFLLQENLVWKSINSHIITMPGYYITRSLFKDAVDSIPNEPLCFISGNFFSGKTIFLLDIAHFFTTKKVYIFPAGTTITEEQLDALVQKENALHCFDSKSLTTAQIKKVSSELVLDGIKKKGSNILIVIDKSDAPMYKYIFEARNASRKFTIFSLDSQFDKSEKAKFNQKVGAISLSPYEKNQTVLDYIVNNEKKISGIPSSQRLFLEPQKELLAQDVQKRIKALVMLATEIRIPANRAIQFGIDGAINGIIKCCDPSGGAAVIEKDYSVYNGNSSGYEFVCNSKYWIIRALSTYAKSDPNSIEIIANAYLSIIKDYRCIYIGNDVAFYQNCEPYYFFDHIQTLFNARWFPNSSKLMNAIYDKLLSELSNSYQFLHQKAKGKLIIAQVQVKNRNRYMANRTLTEAVYNITRAQDLASQYPDAKNIDETLLHMAYTKGRIFIEFSCISDKYIPKTVYACCELYQLQARSKHDIYDFMTAKGNDGWAFNTFKNKLMNRRCLDRCTGLDYNQASSLLQRWTGKRFQIMKRDSSKKPRKK